MPNGTYLLAAILAEIIATSMLKVCDSGHHAAFLLVAVPVYLVTFAALSDVRAPYR